LGRASLLLLALVHLAACRAEPQAPPVFPPPQRSVAPIVSDAYSTEDVRDRAGEFEEVVARAGIRPGMSIADVGAGEGYYTVRLARVVGARGRVLGQDISADITARVSQRARAQGLANVSVQLGAPDDPRLPSNRFDRILLVHMYHEVTQPYAFLWHLREGLKPGGEVIVVDADRPVPRHGIRPALLECELAAVGLKLDLIARLAGGDSYVAAFRATSPRPAPSAIEPCALKE
jgi:ubiquinone/menaquinone biosynthesis C-methylase UbiE